jgi:hypothetical protein
MTRLRLSLCPLIVLLLFSFLVVPSSAQSVESIIEEMRAVQNEQFEGVDTYTVETTHYTSYNKKTGEGNPPTFRTETRMKSDANANVDLGTPSKAYGPQLDHLKQRATYEGTETVNGTQCHTLRVSSLPTESESAGKAQGITYYVSADRHLISRMTMETQGQGQGPGSGQKVITVNLKNYTTTDGLTLPHRIEVQFDLNMSDEQRQQMKQMMEKMKNMPKQQRERMQQMMGGQMDMLKKMMSDEPMVIEVQNVSVNANLPDGIF